LTNAYFCEREIFVAARVKEFVKMHYLMTNPLIVEDPALNSFSERLLKRAVVRVYDSHWRRPAEENHKNTANLLTQRDSKKSSSM
jgi:hypothetical protein